MTITEIAQLADVSKACVSRYFNHGYVSEEKKEKIRKVIEATGYTPSRGIQQPAEKSPTIGIVIPKINSESISRMVSGISQVLNQKGYRMLLADTENDVEKELQYLKSFQQDELAGVIFSATILTEEHFRLLQSMRIPVVILSQEVDGFSCVFHDDYGAAAAMTEQLIHHGHKKIGAIMVTANDRAAGNARMQAYRDTLLKHHLDFSEKHVAYSEFSLESGYDAAQKLLEQAPDLDGIVCATDTIAIGAMQYLKGIGKRIPQDIGITGIGHSRMTEIVEPNLTTTHLFYKSTGIEGADMLVKMIESGIDMKKKLKMGFEVIEQETC